MFDFEIAFYLYKMSAIQKILLDSKYKAKAYYSAALAIDAYGNYVEKMYRENLLQDIPFIGSKIEKVIIEIVETGEFQELIQYEKEYQIKDYSLLLSNGLQDNLLKKLFSLNIRSVYDLFDDANLKILDTHLSKSELNKVEHFMHEFQINQGKYLLSYGMSLGNRLVKKLTEITGVNGAVLCGEVGSFCEKIRIIEIKFSYEGSWNTLIKNIKKITDVVELHNVEYESVTGKTKFGIPFVLIYDMGVNDDTNQDFLIFKKKIKGDLHSHTLWTDGIHSIEQMAEAARERQYEYLAITDHSVSMRIAQGLTESQVLSQIQKIQEYNNTHEMKLLAGIEVDIQADGTLDYSNEILEQCDFVIAAIHSQLNQDPISLYQRLEKALSNPYINILAHPTGRLLGRPGVMFCERKPYEVNIQSIIDLCKKYDVALEVNCFPERLDLSEKNIALAIEQGVKISLGTDAHSLAHLDNIDYGIGILSKLRVDSHMVLNTYSYDEIICYFQKEKTRNTFEKETQLFVRNKKDFDYYFGNNKDIIEGKRSIIGIDLTGSEDKESGWAYLKGRQVQCRRISSNKEIIDTVKLLNPDIISIDSPLAYPKGRCCSRKNCRCSKYGIMRNSEILLRHFGITVYPCLIDSMVNLTTRGMALAKELRSMGYTVIESYPGVAQDVLMIPRKGKTVEQFFHLKHGLQNFGISGDLIDNIDISHDEVDAITSALVGYFYLNGQFVGLGSEEEDYLIVPRIQEELIQKRVIIGLSGETGAGKTTVAEYLRFKYGLKSFRYSKVLEQKYKVSDKTRLQKIGAQIAEDPEEQRQLTKFMIDRMEPGESYVIDGLRHFEDYDELRKHFGKDFIFIYLECRYLNRFKRYSKLHFNEVSEEMFRNINDHKSEKEIVLLQMKSDYRVDNNKGFKDLRMQIDDIVKKESEN